MKYNKEKNAEYNEFSKVTISWLKCIFENCATIPYKSRKL